MVAYLLLKDIVDTISQIMIACRAMQLRFFKVETLLKALFNNVFTLKNLSCMALHAISVFSKV